MINDLNSFVHFATAIIEIHCLATFTGLKHARAFLPSLEKPVGFFAPRFVSPFFRGSPDYGRLRFIGRAAVINNER